MVGRAATLGALTWNIAAINNNPFEYWVTYHDDDYNEFMRGVESLLGQEDNFLVEDIFTTQMYHELAEELRRLDFPNMDEIDKIWARDIGKRYVIHGFLKDKSIGEKRLASMPDRITNTIHLVDGSTLRRPTVINAFGGSPLSTMDSWWASWKKFMFETQVEVFSGKSTTKKQMVWSLISPILRSKYPAITPEEQAISVQLQILYLAILDAVFVCIANRVAPERWEKIRQNLCEALIYNKDHRVCDILATSYKDDHVVFLQEASAAFVHKARSHQALCEPFEIQLPTRFNGKRDQNSVILVSRSTFDIATASDVTDSVLAHIDGNFLEAGDLFALRIDDVIGRGYLLVSFHGDSNGLSTQPVLVGLHEAFVKCFGNHMLIAGIDSNTSSQASDKFHLGVRDFRALLEKQGMVSVWDKLDDRVLTTTCSARTSLQMQLNKAVSFKNRFSMANMSLKDWILAYGVQVEEILCPDRDNTGERRYVGETMLPTTSFPSDHAIVSCRMRPREADNPFSFDRGASGAAMSAEGSTDGGSASSLASTKCGKCSDSTLYDYWGLTDNREIRSLVGSEVVSGEGGSQRNDALPAPPSGHGVADAMGGASEGGASASARQELRALRFSKDDLNRRAGMLVHDSSVWILFSARPMSAVMTKAWFQVFTIVLAVLGLLEVRMHYARASRFAGLDGANFRLKVARRQGAAAVCAGGAVAWSRDAQCVDCATGPGSSVLYGPRPLLSGEDGTPPSLSFPQGPGTADVEISFPRAQSVRGFAFAARGLESASSISLSLDVSSDGSNWTEVTPPPWALVRYKQVPSQEGGGLETRVEWDLMPCWQWMLDWCICPGKMWVMFTCAITLGRLGHGRLGTLVSASNFALNALAFFTIALSYTYGSEIVMPIGASVVKSRAILNFWIFVMIAYEGHYLLDISWFLGGVATSILAYTRGGFRDMESAFSNTAIILWCFGVSTFVNVARRRVRRWISSELIKGDQAVFDALWSSVVSDDGEVGALNRLRLLTRPLSASWSKGGPRQLAGADQAKSRGRPVTNLEDLYAVASLVDPLLQEEAEALARDEGGGLTADVASSRPGAGPLKPMVRAVEKVVRSYDGDPSRILDCCRRCIVFDRVADVLKCMESLTLNEGIEIVRGIRNRLDVGYDARDSAGYRNLVVNLRIKSAKSCQQGTSHHVCELQLALRAFSNALTPESHRRYQILRNCRLELAKSSLLLPLAGWARSVAACWARSVAALPPRAG